MKTFSTWYIKSKNIAIKRYREPIYRIPAGLSFSKIIMPFLELDYNKGDTKIAIQYNNKDFYAAAHPFAKPNFKYLFWKDLQEYLLKHIYYKKGISYIKFEKLDNKHYRVSFWDINNINLDISTYNARTEGKKIESFTTRYERDPTNRLEAIRIHGNKCMACGFDFKAVYGDLGEGFIEVHHINPLSTLDNETIINPATDLICLCSNCHRMIHRNKDTLSLEELKLIIRRNRITP